MWWLTLRLQRAELILLIALAVAITIPFFMTADEGRLTARYDGSVNFTAETCPGDWVTYPDGYTGCNWAPNYFYQSMNTYADGFVGLPIIVAILLAIPAVMQLQSRGYRVAWTQSSTRDRWALTHITLILGVGLAITVGMIFLMRWWPLSSWGGWGLKAFDLRGMVNPGWYVLAVGLVLALATLIRRPLIALVLGAVGYGAIRIGWYFELRPRLLPPLTREMQDPRGIRGAPDDWVLGNWYQRDDGSRVADQDIPRFCSDQGWNLNSGDGFASCYEANGLNTIVTEYHPASRFWPLQFIETGLLVAIGAALIGWTAWYWLRRLE